MMPIQNINSGLVQVVQPASSGNSKHAVDVSQNVAGQPTVAQLKNAVDNINNALKQNSNMLKFNIDADTKKLTVKLVDMETGDVIRQFPSEDMLAISRSIDRVQQGLLLKQEA